MTDTIKELRRLAEAATPGPWFASDWDQDGGPSPTTIESREPEMLGPGQSSIWPDGLRCTPIADTREGHNPIPDAAYIAAASPDVVLRLLDVVEKSQRVMTVYSDEPDTDDPSPEAVRAHSSECEQAWAALRSSLEALGESQLAATVEGEPAQAVPAGQPAHSKSEYKRRVAQGDSNVLPPAGTAAAVSDATGQMLGLYAVQAHAIKELLDALAPHTTGNLQTRVAQVLQGAKSHYGSGHQ